MRPLLSIAVLFILASCGQDEPCCTVEIRVTVPDDTGEVFLAGNIPELGPWSPGLYVMQAEGNERYATLELPRGFQFEYKFTLGSWDREAIREDEAPDTTPFIVRDIEAGLEVPRNVRYWFDYGTVGGDANYDEPHQHLRAWLLDQGLTEGEDFIIHVYEGADHNEAAWRARLADPLLFMFGERAELEP